MLEYQKYRTVNKGLDIEPLIFFIPADMFIPWSIILCLTLLGKGAIGFDWFTTIFIAGWGMATWWLLTYKGAWTFLSKFIAPPHWIRGQGRYCSTIHPEKNDSNQTKNRQ